MNQKVFRTQLVRIILVPLALLLVAFGVQEWNARQLTDAFGWVDHTDVAISQARLVLRTIVDQESGLRGYLQTHDTRFLQQYTRVEDILPQRFAALRDSVSDPEQVARVDRIRDSYDEWHAFAKEAMAAVERNDAVTSTIGFNLLEKDLMDTLRRQQEEFVRAEDKMRESRVRHSLRHTRLVDWSAGVLAALFGLALLLETRRNVRLVDREYASLVAKLNQRATELRESRERLEVTLRSIGDGVIATNAEGKITFLNAVAQELTQFSNESACGRTLGEVFHVIEEQSRERAESPVEQVIRRNLTVDAADRRILLRPDGTEIYVDDRGAPIRNDNGDLLGVVLVFRDITQQRRALDALRSNEKLVAAGRLSASIAHEIHNPLDIVMNLLFLMQRSEPREHSGLMELAQQELSRVAQITKSMLGLYRESPEPITVNIGEIVQGIDVLLESKMRAKRVRLNKCCSARGEVKGFPAELRQVVSNLVGNAIDAVGPEGTVEVAISDERMSDGRAGVLLCVRDNGSGISNDKMQQLFRPFFTTKGEKGTGLGLWISQGIVEKHGGYLEVESSVSPGSSGACFRVYLPRCEGEPVVAASVACV
ncbi:MAG: ATP-binding protein [Acidobacteriaceae bacterium]